MSYTRRLEQSNSKPAPPSRQALSWQSPSVRRALGPDAVQLLAYGLRIKFRALLERPDTPVVSFLRRRAAEALHMTPRRVRAALGRLSEAGLHRYVGQGYAFVDYRGELDKMKRVPIREFRETAPELEAWLRERNAQARKHGGRRAGAGRPKRGEERPPKPLKAPRKRRVEPSESPPPETGAKPLKITQISPAESPVDESSLADKRDRTKKELDPSSCSLREQDPQGALARLASLADGAEEPERPVSRRLKQGIVACSGDLRPDTKAKLLRLGGRAIPPEPSEALVPMIDCPPPAELDLAGSPVEHARILGHAYRTIVREKLGKVVWLEGLTPAQLEAHKAFPLLVRAADELLRQRIPPLAWVEFSLAVWARRNKTKPPAKWVFSPKRIREKRDWYDAEHDAPKRRLHAPSALKLAILHQQMWRELLREKPADIASLRAIVDQFFPGTMYAQLVLKARVEAAKISKQLLARAYGDE